MEEGNLPGVLELPWPWPPKNSVTALSRKFNGGKVTLTIEPNGRMRVRLLHADTATEILSCPLHQRERTATTICIIWKRGRLDLLLDAVLVASTYDKPAADMYSRHLTSRLRCTISLPKTKRQGERGGTR